jgi:hypothetical protein
MSKTTERIRALYYPYAYPRTINVLKYALLVFDELWFIDPLARQYRWALMYSQFGESWDTIREALDYLVDKGIVRIYDPRRIVIERDFELAKAIEEDIADPLFGQISDVLAGGRWSVAIDRLPPSLRHGDFEFRAIHGFLPVFDGFVMNLNLTFAVADENSNLNLVPFTDSDVAQHALSLKYHKVTHEHPLESDLNLVPIVLTKRSSDQLFRYNVLAMNILHDLVPAGSLDPLSIKQVVEYREQASEAMAVLKNKILALTHNLTAEVLTPEFKRQMVEVIDDMRLEEQRARTEMANIYKDMFSGVVAKGLATALPSLVACVYSNASYQQLLTVGTSAFVISAVTEAAKAASARASHQENCLSYFLNLQQKKPLRFGRWARIFAKSSKSRYRMVAYLVQALSDKDVHVRRLAARTLVGIDDPRSIIAMKQALLDQDRLVQYWAKEGLKKAGIRSAHGEWL